MHTTRDPNFEINRSIAEQQTKRERQTKRNLIFAQNLLSGDMARTRDLWVNAWKEYERAVVDAEVRQKAWTDAATTMKATNDLRATSKAISEVRTAFKQHIMANGEINGSIDEAYFTTTRDETFVALRLAVEEATQAHNAAVRAHTFDAETIPEYYRWRIADKRQRVLWELAEVAMAEIEVIANANAMDRFAEDEGLKGEAAEIISSAYYSRFPMADLHPFLSSLYGTPSHAAIGGMTGNSMERETRIAARITGDKLLAVPMREVHAEIQERLEKISPERQEQLTEEYARSLGITSPHEPAELEPAETIASTDPGFFSRTPEEAVEKALGADAAEKPSEG